MRYAGAAYVAGGFPAMPRGLNPREFWPTLTRHLAARRPGCRVTVLTAKVDGAEGVPIAWLLCWPHALGGPRSLEVHAAWAPWATARMRLEAVAAYLLRVREAFSLIWCCRRAQARFFEHLCRLGLARKAGVLRGFYGRGDDAVMFHSVESGR